MRLLIAALAFVLLYMVQNKIYKKYWDKKLDAELRFSRDYMECGETAELIETVTNNKLLPLPTLNLKFSVDKSLDFNGKENSSISDYYNKNEIFSILGNTKAVRKLSFKALKRGIFEIKNSSVLVKDFFMTETFAKQIKNDDLLYVFPKKISTERFCILSNNIIGEIESQRSLIFDELIFTGIREYQTWDSYRSINWKQSAKANSLMVNMHGYTIDREVIVMLNLDTDMMIETDKILEEAISLTSSLTLMLLKKNAKVSFVTNGKNKDGKKLVTIEAGSDISHQISIDRELSEISGSEGKDFFLSLIDKEIKNPDYSKLYIIISPYHKADLIEKLDKLKATGCGVIFTALYYDEFPYRPDRDYIKCWEVGFNV